MSIWSKLANITANKKDCRGSLVSFTFDDAPLSSFEIGGNILENFGFKGTYYLSAGLIGKETNLGRISDLDTINEFFSRGHEIGNHTYKHLDCGKANIPSIIYSIKRNRKMLHRVMGDSFAYPYGSKSDKAKFVIRPFFESARGISLGVNKGAVNLMDLKSVRVYSNRGIDICMDKIAECAEEGGWLIFYTHDVTDSPSEYGCTPEDFTRLVETVSRKKLPVVTVGEGVKYLQAIRR